MSDEGFLSRWARRKERARMGEPVPPMSEPTSEALPAQPSTAEQQPTADVCSEQAPAGAVGAEPLPTLADVALLTRDSDYSRFVAGGVDEGVKRAAMKKLFQDPHFNVMDGLDTYIDDYGKPDPIPLSMLKQMNQSKYLRLFEDDEEELKTSEMTVASSIPVDTLITPTESVDDDPNLQLQPDDDAGQPGPDQGPRA